MTVEQTLLDLFDLTGTHAIITGGASGIGLRMATALGGAGAEVTLLDREAERAEQAADGLKEQGIAAYAAVADTTDREGLDAVFAEIAAARPFQVVFANAGISAGAGPIAENGKLTTFDPDRWDAVISVNLTGTVNTMASAARHMTPGGRGRIIVTASLGGVRADPLVGYSYAAAKTGIIGVVRNASLELGPQGITVNAIAPGLFETNIRKNNPQAEALTPMFSKMSVLGRSAEPEELDGLAIYLASPASSYMTGAVLNLDGGGQHVGPNSLS